MQAEISNNNLKLYLWSGSVGEREYVFFAIATSVEVARDLILKGAEDRYGDQLFTMSLISQVISINPFTVRKVDRPMAYGRLSGEG